MRVTVEPTATWAAGVPTRLFLGSFFGGANNERPYDVSLDDRRFLMIKEAETLSDAGPSLIVVQNWLEEVKRLVPIQ